MKNDYSDGYTKTGRRLMMAADALDHPRNTYDDPAAFHADQADVETLRKACSILEHMVEEGGPFDPDTCLEDDEKPTRYIATFVPQAWQGKYLITVDPEGETEWDCTDYLRQFDAAHIEKVLAGGCLESDHVTASLNTPQWVKDWSGPFEVEVNEEEVE